MPTRGRTDNLHPQRLSRFYDYEMLFGTFLEGRRKFRWDPSGLNQASRAKLDEAKLVVKLHNLAL